MNENIKALINGAGANVMDDGIMFGTLDILKLAVDVAKASAQVCADNGDQAGADAIKAHFGLE